MKTWKQIKMECLGLMFSRTDGGNIVSLDNADVKDYTNEMADAANYALLDLADVARPVVKSIEITNTTEGYTRHDLKALAPDLMRTLPKVLRGTTSVEDYILMGDTLLLRGAGTYQVFYKAYPGLVTAETRDDETFDIAAEALELVPLFMASRIYMDDDVSIAISYLNQYQARREELMATYTDGLDGAPGGFQSVTGWV